MDTFSQKKWQYLTFGFMGIVAMNTFFSRLCMKKCSKSIENKALEIEEEVKKEVIEESKEIQVADASPVDEKIQNPPKVFLPLTLGRRYIPPMKYPNIKRICFTGGPCGGKTSSMDYVTEKLKQLGYEVMIIPEAPTIIAKGGGLIDIQKMDAPTLIKFQNQLMKIVIDMEDDFVEYARSLYGDKPTIILCDRGSIDPRAYMPPSIWECLLADNNWNIFDLRDNRYHGVIHLVTTADGAEEHYSLENNAARYENTHELARSVDINSRNAWLGHYSHIMIDNSHPDGFKGKLERVGKAVLSLLGRMEHSFYKKYLLKHVNGEYPDVPTDFRKEAFDIEETYLQTENENIIEKVCKRSKHGHSFYTHLKIDQTYKADDNLIPNDDDNNKHPELDIISSGEYLELLKRKDETRKVIYKRRLHFIWERMVVYIDTFINAGGFSILYADFTKEIMTLRLPEGLSIERDVTNEPEYKTNRLAMINQSLRE